MTLKDFINYACFTDFRKSIYNNSFHYYIKNKNECVFSEFGMLRFKLVINNTNYIPRFVIIDNKFVVVRCNIGSMIEKQLQINDFELLNDDQLDTQVSLNHKVTNSARPSTSIIYNNRLLSKYYQSEFDKIANINPTG